MAVGSGLDAGMVAIDPGVPRLSQDWGGMEAKTKRNKWREKIEKDSYHSIMNRTKRKYTQTKIGN